MSPLLSNSASGRSYGGIAAPQFGQNLPFPATGWLHLGQVRGGGGAVEAPQLGQNLTPAGTGCPHFGHGAPAAAAGGAPRACPHPGQKRVPAGTSVPHLGHGVEGPCWYIPCI